MGIIFTTCIQRLLAFVYVFVADAHIDYIKDGKAVKYIDLL